MEFVGVLEPRARRWLAAALPASVVVALLRDPWVSLAGALAQGLGFVQVDVATSIVASAVSVSPLLALLSVVVLASRRSARATITPDHVVVRPLHLRWPVLTIPLVDVVARRTTAHGVILDAPAAVPRALAWLLTPLVPARTAEELARAHAALDAPHVGGAPALARAGRIVGRTEVVALLLVVLAWVVLVEVLRAVIGGGAAASLHALGAALLFALGALALPSRARVHLGAETVSVGGLCVAWAEVTRLAASGPWVTLEAGRRRRAARLSRREVARVFRAAQERLTRDGRRAVVEAAGSRWVRGRRAVLGASAVVVASLAAVTGPLRYRTLEGVLEFYSGGGHGPTVLLVYRKHDLAPRLVIFVEGEPDRSQRRASASFPRGVTWSSRWSSSPPDGWSHVDVDVDVRRGLVCVLGREHPIPVGATVVHVQVGSVVASAIPLGPPGPRLRGLVDGGPYAGLGDFAGCFTDLDDPILLGALTGRTSTRCFEVHAVDGQVIAKVQRGRVLSVCVAGPGITIRACFRCVPCVLARESPGRLERVQSSNDGLEETEAELPAFADVRETLAAIEAGATIAEATAGWPRPAGVSRER